MDEYLGIFFSPKEMIVMLPLFSLSLYRNILNTKHFFFLKGMFLDFPGGTVYKNLPVSAGDTGWIPGLGRFHMPQSN